MKKIICIVLLALMLTGCNYQVFDFHYTFDKAICNYDGDKFELEIDSWRDYEDGEQFQIESKGKTYLVSANKCYFIKEGKNE